MTDFAREPIPDYGDHMTMAEFVSACQQGLFVDDDGSGCYATDTELVRKSIMPSDVRVGVHDTTFSHVVWFNK